MGPTKVILLSCGSYNPPTNMHLRMFEIARDHLHKMGSHVVLGGVISPVHDLYGKKDLARGTDRCAMLRLALQNNDWIKLSDWESKRECWTKTRVTLQHHQNVLNSWVFDTDDIKHHSEIEDMEWIPNKIKNSSYQERNPIQVKLLCGADLLESFGTPGLWAEEDIDAIVGQHGLVVVTREGSNPNQFIYDSDLLSKYMHNIIIVTEWITNEISSSKIRRALKRGESVKYLLQDSVLDYIYKHGIYDARKTTEIKLEISSNSGNSYLNINTKYDNSFLTPSPSDITMETPSPVEIISIDIPDSILKKNFINSTGFTSNYSKIPINKFDDNDSVRDKFLGVMAENGNKLLHNMKNAYPGQAKQIIATETGETQILEEVGSSYDQNNQSLIPKSHAESLDKDNTDVVQASDDLTVNEDNLVSIIPKLRDDNDDVKRTAEDPEVRNSNLVIAGSNTELKTVAEVCETDENVQAKDDGVPPPIDNDSDETEGKSIVDKETLEIDGKYLKSLVNSRKSPKKCKNKVEKFLIKDDAINDVTVLDAENICKLKEDGATQCEKIDSVNSESQTDLNFDENYEKTFLPVGKKLSKLSEQLFVIQGSLDSVKFNIPNKRATALDSVSKKSKSFESIKYDSSKSISYKSFEISLSDNLKPKSESTSQLVTANFCTECCYEKETFVPELSSNQDTFYTVQSNRSTPVEGDSTECDICSACNLDSTEILDAKSMSVADKCDICEICNDINADFEGDLVMPYPDIETDNILPINCDSDFTLVPENENDEFEIENCGFEADVEQSLINYREEEEEETKDYEVKSILEEESDLLCDNSDPEMKDARDNDDFEIENCGLDNEVKSLKSRDSKLNFKFFKNESDDVNPDRKYNRASNVIYSSNDNVKFSTKFSLPKYVPNLSSKGGKKIGRKGSFIIKDSSCKLFQDNRRYSSVDNLQNSKQILKLSDRVFQKTKGNKLIVGSADNIQSNVTKNTKIKKLQKSVNDIDSLTENFDSSTENFTLSENNLLPADSKRVVDLSDKIKTRDNDMVKMILTKHGIKIISEKETAL